MNFQVSTELDLLSSLQTLGAIRRLNGLNWLPTNVVNLDVSDSLLTESKESETNINLGYSKKYEKSESLRLIRHLVDGLLNVHVRGSSLVSRYLKVVMPSLFGFFNDSDLDVRIAADENLNKLIKVCLLVFCNIVEIFKL